MVLLGGHVGWGDGRDAVGGHRVLHLMMVAGPRREGRRGVGAATHVGMTMPVVGSGVVVHAAAMRRRRRRYEVPPRSTSTAGALVLTLLELAHGGAGSTNNTLYARLVGRLQYWNR